MDTKSLKLLYVEDDLSISKAITGLFSRFFGEVIVAENGKEGLELFLENMEDIHLIITDLRMPVMNGLEMISEIKQVNDLVPIYITSGDVSLKDEALDLNINGFYNKPVDFTKLISQISEDFKK